jgi:hypothetical protein
VFNSQFSIPKRTSKIIEGPPLSIGLVKWGFTRNGETPMSTALAVELTLLSMIVAVMYAAYVMFKTRDFRGQPADAGGVRASVFHHEAQDLTGSTAVQSMTAETPELRTAAIEPQSAPLEKPKLSTANDDNARLRKEVIGQDPEVRFAVLKDWLSINMLAIFRRAYGDWKRATDLIAIVPASLEPEVEILDGGVLLIGTRDHAEQLAVPIRDLDSSSNLRQYFDFTNGQFVANRPAVVIRNEAHLELVSKGKIAWTAPARMPSVDRRPRSAQWWMECIIVAGFTATGAEREFQHYIQEAMPQNRSIRQWMSQPEGH